MKSFSASVNLLKALALLSATAFFMPLATSAQQVITIQQAVDSTLKNNLQIKQAMFGAALSNEALDASRYAVLPNLNAGISPSFSFGRGQDQSTLQIVNQTSFFLNYSASTNITVFRGMQLINQIRQAKIQLEVDKTNVNVVKNNLILSVVTSYLQVLYNTDLLKASQEQLVIANQTLKREQELINVGDKTLADLSQAKSQVATAELNVTNALNALEISYLTLGQLMELPPTQRFLVQAPLFDGTGNVNAAVNANDVYQSALNTFPDIKLYGLRTEVAKKGIDIARGNHFPSVSLGANLGSSYSYYFNLIGPTGAAAVQRSFTEQFNDRFGQGIGASIQIPLFNGFSARTAVRRAKISYESARVDEQSVKNTLSKTIYQASADLRAAESNYQSTKNTFDAQKDAFYVIEQRYNVGLVNSLDYSTARTNMNKAETDMIQAKYNLIFRAKVIDYYLGKQITF